MIHSWSPFRGWPVAMPWIMTESPLAIETVFEVGDATGSKSRAPAGIPISEMPMMNRHAQLIIRHIVFFVMVHFQYVYDGFREKNLFVLLNKAVAGC